MSLVEKIVPACAWVMQQACHVKIQQEKIPAYTSFILDKYPLITTIDSTIHHVAKDREETAAYILALDSINFGSGYFHIAKSCGVALEYQVIAEGLKKTFERRELLTPQQWASATAEQMAQMLSIPMGLHADLDKLMALFASHLQGTGRKVIEDYQGHVINLIESADHSALKLANIVATWNGFNDVHTYQKRQIPILKRAQILAADLHLAFAGFKDMDALTIFADNMVPHVLRCDGILDYSPTLAAKIDAGIPLLPGSAQEIEIRAAAIYAVELMKAAAEKKVTSVNLDHLLWHRGYEIEIYQKSTHRTLTTDY